MTIEMQKKIRFIPFLNFLLIGIQWLKAFQKGLPIKRLFLTLFIVFSIGVICMLPHLFLGSFLNLSPEIDIVINLFETFVIMFVFSFRAIYDQKSV